METKLNIMVFGQLTDITGSETVSVNDVTDTELLLEKLYKQFPLLKEKKFLIAVNQKIINSKTEIGSQSQIALLPPFSGG
jgi:molybdopterin converting factor small subunit